jgi:hypothetical protein
MAGDLYTRISTIDAGSAESAEINTLFKEAKSNPETYNVSKFPFFATAYTNNKYGPEKHRDRNSTERTEIELNCNAVRQNSIFTIIDIYEKTEKIQEESAKIERDNIESFLLECTRDSIVRKAILEMAVNFDTDKLMQKYNKSFPSGEIIRGKHKQDSTSDRFAAMRGGIIYVIGEKIALAQDQTEIGWLIDFMHETFYDKHPYVREATAKVMEEIVELRDFSRDPEVVAFLHDIARKYKSAESALKKIMDLSANKNTREILGIISQVDNIRAHSEELLHELYQKLKAEKPEDKENL